MQRLCTGQPPLCPQPDMETYMLMTSPANWLPSLSWLSDCYSMVTVLVALLLPWPTLPLQSKLISKVLIDCFLLEEQYFLGFQRQTYLKCSSTCQLALVVTDFLLYIENLGITKRIFIITFVKQIQVPVYWHFSSKETRGFPFNLHVTAHYTGTIHISIDSTISDVALTSITWETNCSHDFAHYPKQPFFGFRYQILFSLTFLQKGLAGLSVFKG